VVDLKHVSDYDAARIKRGMFQSICCALSKDFRFFRHDVRNQLTLLHMHGQSY
jgi:hypothetical protein